MISLLTFLLMAATDWTPAIQTAVAAHYDSLLAGKTVRYELTALRIPEVRGGSLSITGVHGDETSALPRGTRLCWVDAEVDGRSRSLPVTLRLETTELCPVARLNLKARQAIEPEDVDWVELSTTGLGGAQLMPPDEIGAVQARVNLAAGTILTRARVMAIPDVRAGQELPLVSVVGSVQITAPGRALADGFTGDNIAVVNLDSGQRLRGVVAPDGRIMVE